MSLCLLASVAAQAAPVAEQEEASPPPAEEFRQGQPNKDVTGGKKTVDLLLEMQPRSAGLEFKERRLPQRGSGEPTSTDAKPSGPGTKAAAGADADQRAQAIPVAPSGLFGSGAANPAAATPRADSSRAAEPVQPEPWRAGAERQPGGTQGDAAASSGLVRLWILPREVIDYVRDNREWFIAGIVLAFGALWLRSGGLASRR